QQAGPEPALGTGAQPAVGRLLRRQVQVQSQEPLRFDEVALPDKAYPEAANRRHGRTAGSFPENLSRLTEVPPQGGRLAAPPCRGVKAGQARLAAQRPRVRWAQVLQVALVTFLGFPFRLREPVRRIVDDSQHPPRSQGPEAFLTQLLLLHLQCLDEERLCLVGAPLQKVDIAQLEHQLARDKSPVAELALGGFQRLDDQRFRALALASPTVKGGEVFHGPEGFGVVGAEDTDSSFEGPE